MKPPVLNRYNPEHGENGSCFRCKAPSEGITLILGRTGYCVECGWNREEAEVEIRTELLSMVAVLILSFGFPVLSGVQESRGSLDGAAILAEALALPHCNGIPAYRRMRQLKSLLPLRHSRSLDECYGPVNINHLEV